MLLFCCSGAVAEDGKGKAQLDWSRLMVVNAPHAEGGFFVAAFSHLTSRGADNQTAAKVLRGLNRHVNDMTGRGKSVTLSMAMVVDAIEAALGANWSIEDTSRLLVTLQVQMDSEKRPALERVRETIAKVRLGGTPDQILG